MRLRLAFACLLVASLAPAQTSPGSPNGVKLTKFILGVADLDRSYAFYHALGLELDNNATALSKPAALPDTLLKLVDVPPGTKFRNMMLKIPGAAFPLEVTEFSGMDLHPASPRIQDPGAAVLHLVVDNVDAALAIAKRAGAEVVTKGGSPIGRALHSVTVKDPDGYYVGLREAPGGTTGTGKVVGVVFGSMTVADSAKAATFYHNQLGFLMDITDWTTDDEGLWGAPGTQTRNTSTYAIGSDFFWSFIQSKDADRKAQTPRIPDPGAAAVGIQVRDIDAAIAAVKAAGGSSITQGGSVKLGNSKVGFVRDPSGILVELTQP